MFDSIKCWFDTQTQAPVHGDPDKIDWLRAVPFLAVHAGCLGVLWTGVSPVAVALGVFLYLLRMFAITGFYHRYFSHRSFRTSRPVAFLFAFIACSSAQRGPLWWAAHHRHHHKDSDRPSDPHSPAQHGFWWSHCGWFLAPRHFPTRHELLRDFKEHRELHWLNRFDMLPPVCLGLACLALGWALQHWAPSLGTNPGQMLVVGFAISTTLLYHGTFSINSLSHLWGSRPHSTGDDSRNNFLLALITLGEGWHNNHHRFPAYTNQGHRWWQIDITLWTLRSLSLLGLVRDLRIYRPASVAVPVEAPALPEFEHNQG
jgi:stearoyl-CoA desaturase (Delta-9 desaturase)